MANLAAENTFDTQSVDGNCTYPATALGGTPTISANVYMNGQPLRSYDSSSVVSPVPGVKINPLNPLPCQPGTRVITPAVNTTVFINGKLPAVQGDNAALLGTPRPLTGPFQHVNIMIGSNI
tara:strand:- start:63 stop:428 length:366 start_codon:yes stop_codon:yes gene_type:complete